MEGMLAGQLGHTYKKREDNAVYLVWTCSILYYTSLSLWLFAAAQRCDARYQFQQFSLLLALSELVE